MTFENNCVDKTKKMYDNNCGYNIIVVSFVAKPFRNIS
jgi:hypothetical protein